MDEKVCPKCGNGYFYRHRLLQQDVIVNGNGGEVEVLSSSFTAFSDKMNCTECGTELIEEKLVTESHFHEVIALEEKEHVHQ